MKQKNLYFIILICISLFFTNCNPQNDIPNKVDELESIAVERFSQTRANSSNITSESNPTLHDDWENVRFVELNKNKRFDAPWAEGDFSNNIPDDVRKDVKKEDGWVMLGHTMIYSRDDGPSYIFLYNKKRGLLKVFYYNDFPQNNQNIIWVVESKYRKPTSIFPTWDIVQQPINRAQPYSITTSNVLKDRSQLFHNLTPHWNVFCCELIYGTENDNPTVDIWAFFKEQFSLELEGNFRGYVKIPSTKVKPNGTLADMSKYLDYASGIATLIGKFKKDKPAKSTTTTEVRPETRSVIGTIVAIGGVVSALSGLFGKASVHLGKTKTVYTHAETQGSMEAQGKISRSVSGVVASYDGLNLKEMNNDESLGLWNIKEDYTMEIYDSPKEKIVPAMFPIENEIGKYYGGKAYLIDEFSNGVTQDLKSNIIINPCIQKDIKDFKVDLIYLVKNTEKLKSMGFIYDRTSFANFIILRNFGYNTYFNSFEIYEPDNTVLTAMGKPALNTPYSFYNVSQMLYINVVLTINYNDNSTVVSSRIFKPIIKRV